jgi:hypothetical protein
VLERFLINGRYNNVLIMIQRTPDSEREIVKIIVQSIEESEILDD